MSCVRKEASEPRLVDKPANCPGPSLRERLHDSDRASFSLPLLVYFIGELDNTGSDNAGSKRLDFYSNN